MDCQLSRLVKGEDHNLIDELLTLLVSRQLRRLSASRVSNNDRPVNHLGKAKVVLQLLEVAPTAFITNGTESELDHLVTPEDLVLATQILKFVVLFDRTFLSDLAVELTLDLLHLNICLRVITNQLDWNCNLVLHMKIESFPASLTRGPTALNLQLDTNMIAWHVDVSVEFEVVGPNGL